MADKYHSDTQEKTELIRYRPVLQDSGDLEAGTKTITATSKPGTPDYTTNLTTPASLDSRLVVKRLGHRLLIHIDSFGGSPGATKLCYSVEVNGVERATGEFTGAGADNVKAWALTEGQFNLGSANTLEVFLWVDQGNAVVSVCQLWQAIGVPGVSFPFQPAMTAIVVKHSGMLIPQALAAMDGTGTNYLYVCNSDAVWAEEVQVKVISGQYTSLNFEGITMVEDELVIRTNSTVDTDLPFVYAASFVLKSEK